MINKFKKFKQDICLYAEFNSNNAMLDYKCGFFTIKQNNICFFKISYNRVEIKINYYHKLNTWNTYRKIVYTC